MFNVRVKPDIHCELDWHLLNKFLPLKENSANGIAEHQNTFGIVLGFVDGGYFSKNSCVPADCEKRSFACQDRACCERTGCPHAQLRL